jgi:hypothetical protein
MKEITLQFPDDLWERLQWAIDYEIKKTDKFNSGWYERHGLTDIANNLMWTIATWVEITEESAVVKAPSNDR